jgi:hypothetical protein
MSKERYNQIIDEAYENYCSNAYKEEYDRLSQNGLFEIDLEWVGFTKEQFINRIKTNPEFSERWGLKIEERELSLEERFNIRYPGGKFSVFQENYPNTHKRNDPNGLLDAFDIPTKLNTLTYNNETIESYE